MATHSSIPAWEIPRMEEPGGLQSMGSQRVRHDLVIKPPPPALLEENLRVSLRSYTSTGQSMASDCGSPWAAQGSMSRWEACAIL